MSGFEDLPLHDAIVHRIALLWKERTIEFEILAFAEHGKDAFPHRLQFIGVKNFNCPHHSPWGDSFQINEATCKEGKFLIEMQSGDEIRVEAAGYSFVSANS